MRKLVLASVLAFATIAAVTSPTRAQFLFSPFGGYYGGFGGFGGLPFPYRHYYSPYDDGDPYYAVPYRYHHRYYHRHHYHHRHHHHHHHRHHYHHRYYYR